MSSIFRSHAHGFLVLASFSASFSAAGCSSGFSSCVELATCGGAGGEGGGSAAADATSGASNGETEAGSSGDGSSAGGSGHAGSPDAAGRAGSAGAGEGEGGEGGAGADVAGAEGGVGGDGASGCQSDAACDDGLACNGIERCVEGSCGPGDAVVCEGALDGCEAECEEQDSGPRCVPRAADGDGDGHASSACGAAFGDDCDDRNSSVHAGAPELCDTLDNDCDGSVDLSDEVPMKAASVTIQGFSPSVVWSEHHAVFGVLWVGRSGAASQLAGGTISTAGVLQPWSVVSFSSTSATYLAPSLAAIDSGFFAVYQTGNRGGQVGHFAVIEDNGAAHGSQFDALHSDIALGSHGVLNFAGERAGALRMENLERDGSSTSSSFETSPISPRVAVIGADVAAIWQVKDTLTVKGLHKNVLVEPRYGAGDGAASPDITAAGGSYALAWSTPNGVFHQRMNVDGSFPCIGVETTLRADAISDRSLAIAGTDRHSFVLVTDKLRNVVNLLRFDAACRLIDQAELEASAVPSRPSIAVGGGHVAACWSEGTSEDHSECRVMSVELCAGDASASRHIDP